MTSRLEKSGLEGPHCNVIGIYLSQEQLWGLVEGGSAANKPGSLEVPLIMSPSFKVAVLGGHQVHPMHVGHSGSMHIEIEGVLYTPCYQSPIPPCINADRAPPKSRDVLVLVCRQTQ